MGCEVQLTRTTPQRMARPNPLLPIYIQIEWIASQNGTQRTSNMHMERMYTPHLHTAKRINYLTQRAIASAPSFVRRLGKVQSISLGAKRSECKCAAYRAPISPSPDNWHPVTASRLSRRSPDNARSAVSVMNAHDKSDKSRSAVHVRSGSRIETLLSEICNRSSSGRQTCSSAFPGNREAMAWKWCSRVRFDSDTNDTEGIFGQRRMIKVFSLLSVHSAAIPRAPNAGLVCTEKRTSWRSSESHPKPSLLSAFGRVRFSDLSWLK